MKQGDKVRLTEMGRESWVRVYETEAPTGDGEVTGVGYGAKFFQVDFGREEQEDAFPDTFCPFAAEYIEPVSK